MAKMSAEDARRLSDYYRQMNDDLKQQAGILSGINNSEERRRIAAQEIANNQKIINELEREYLKGNNAVKAELDKINAIQKDLLNKEKNINTQLENQVKKRQRNLDLAKQLGEQIKNGWKYLQEQDKIIKSTNLSLGLSGNKAIAMRDAFEQSAGYVARLGGSIGDIQTIMQGYADETGRARVMTAQMVEDITNIGKGTGLGIEQATKLGAQFEIMGFDARTTMEYVQGVVDTTERMGVNTTKVLKTVNDNFKRLNTYTFKKGVQGFADMAMFAEKFKVDINQALNTVDIAKTLEGSIDMAAQLQVMGGEFAKSNPFELMYLARNEPEKMAEKIGDMTKGLVSFRKMSDGTFEKFISPADRDRIAAVAKSMGMEASALTEISLRQADIQKMRQQMGGLGLSDEQKQIIEGAAIFDKTSGKFQVQLGETMINIGNLTKEQAEKFKVEQKLLEERAKQAMTFDETFKATINSLKTTLLPLLKGVNQVLTATSEFLKPAIDWLKKGDLAWAKVAGLFISAGLLWKGILQPLAGRLGAATVGRVGGAIRGTRGLSAAIPTDTGSVSGLVEQRRGIGAGAAAKGVGMKRLGTGAGIGAGALGMGAGIGAAAAGISKLADSMSKLDDKQAKTLQKIVTTLGIAVGILPLVAFGIAAFAPAATAAAGPMLAFGAAVALVGGGIGFASMGIGKMAEGFGSMIKEAKEAGPAMGEIGKGMLAMSASMVGFTAGALGFVVFSQTMKKIAKYSDDLDRVGIAFGNIQAVMSGSKDDFIAVENAVKSIANANISTGGMFTELANLLKKPLQVEFKDKNLAVVSNITMEIDGKKIFNQTYSPTAAVEKHENAKNNKGDRT